MQYKMEVEAYSQYLSLAQNGLINFDIIEKLDEFDKNKTKSVLKILRMEGLIDHQQFLEKMINCQEYDGIENILEYFIIYRSDIARRDFLFENESNIYLRPIANLLKNDFLFNNDKFVKKIIDRTENRFYSFEIFLAIDDLSRVVDIYPNIYGEDIKNETLEKTFNISCPSDLLEMVLDISCPFDMLKLAEVLRIKYFYQQPIWISYFMRLANEIQTNSALGVMKKVYIEKFGLLERKGKMDILHEKLLEIDSSDMTDEEKCNCFLRFAENVSKIKEKTIDKEDDFTFLIEGICKDGKEFDRDVNWVTWYRYMNIDKKEQPPQKTLGTK